MTDRLHFVYYELYEVAGLKTLKRVGKIFVHANIVPKQHITSYKSKLNDFIFLT